MSIELSLSRPRRRRLVRIMKTTSDAGIFVRCQILLHVAGGMSCRAAALAAACVPSTGWNIVDRFRLEGEACLIDRRGENGQRKVDEDVEGGIRRVLVGTPQDHGYARPTWTLQILSAVVTQVLGVQLSVGHLWKVLRRMHIRWGRARPVVACPWKTRRRQRRIAQLRRLAAEPQPYEVVLFVDEVDLHLNPRIGPDWMLPGTQRMVVTPGQNQKRYLAGAYDHRGERLIYVEGDRKVSWLFLNLLRALLDAFRNLKVIHLILDNYIIHKSRLVAAWLAVYGRKFRLHFLPPYTPEENRIERLWKDLHDNVTRNHCCRTIGQLLDAVRHYLSQRFGAWPAQLVSP
jgi:transposase